MPKIKYKRVDVVFKRDLNEFKGWNSFKLTIVLFILMTLAAAAGGTLLLRSGALVQMGENSTMLKVIMGNMVFLLTFIPLMVNIPLFTSEPLAREKSNGTIVSLLSTRLSPGEILMGKSLAVFLPGFIVSIASPLFVALVVNYTAILPAAGYFYLPLPLILTAFVVNPVLFFGLTVFTIQVSMIKTPELAAAPSYLVGFGLLIGIPVGSVTGIIDLSSWAFLLLYGALAVCMWLVVWGFSFLLTKERIMLSK